MDHSIKQNQIIHIIGNIMAKEILRKFDFCKKLFSKVSAPHSYSFYRTKSYCTPLKREFCARFNDVRHIYVACLVLTLDAETLEDVFLEHPLEIKISCYEVPLEFRRTIQNSRAKKQVGVAAGSTLNID